MNVMNSLLLSLLFDIQIKPISSNSYSRINTTNNLNSEETKVLRSLREDNSIVTQPTDKGNATVII